MAYLSPFKYDIFISYARINDRKPPGKDKGWVTLFNEYLEFELSQRFERMGTIKIWYDTDEIGGGTYFNEAIEQSINETGIFLALTSRGYLSPESYCKKELNWFHQKAKSDAYGLKLGTRSRLLNLQIQNISRQEWPAEFTGTSELEFFDPQQSGQPSSLGGELFTEQLRQLVDVVELTLRQFRSEIDRKAAVKAEAAAVKDPFTVFVGYAEGSLRTTRNRVIEELKQNGVQVVSNIPPPYDAPLHEQKVIAELKRADLSIHLLEETAGAEIENAPGNFYYKRQVELGLECAKSQLIWIPKTLDVQSIEDINHRDFLDHLENGNREGASYSFLRETPGSITREVLAYIDRLRQGRQRLPAPPPSATLLDAHLEDQRYTLDLTRIIIERKVPLYFKTEVDEPQQNIVLFQQLLKQVSVLIIVFGMVAAEWVNERIVSALQIAIAEKCPLKLCGVYLPEIEGGEANRQSQLKSFPRGLPIFLFHSPEDLEPLLDNFTGRQP